jgi:cytochrome c553
MYIKTGIIILIVLAMFVIPSIAATPSVNYATHCTGCHGANQQGGIGPAITPAGLSNLSITTATQLNAILSPGGVMSSYTTSMSSSDILALSDWLLNPTPTQVLSTITVSPSTATLAGGATQTFTATAVDQNGNPMEGINITLMSDNITVGTVSPENVMTIAGGNATTTFTANVAGTAMVNASNGSVTGSADVTVSEVVVPVLTTITVSPSTATLAGGATQTFTATAVDQNGNPMEGINITLMSNNITVGTVSPENVMTIAGGNATTTFTANVAGTAMVNASNGSVTGSADVTVTTVLPAAGSISGMKFNDLNNNSIKDTGEPGLAGWTIVLTIPGGSTATMATDANGSYTFSNLAQGNYTVAEVQEVGWKQTHPEAPGIYDVTLAAGENMTGIDFGNNLPVTPPVNVTIAVRMIEKGSLRQGESTNITVDINSNMNKALALQELIPAGWNITRISDDADAFKSSTSEWIWLNVSTGINKTVIYRLTAPDNVSIGTYHINGTISSGSGVIAVVQGDNTITLDIIAFYRRLGSDTNRVETTDVLRAAEDWRNNIAPAGFERAITTQELLALVDEWMKN